MILQPSAVKTKLPRLERATVACEFSHHEFRPHNCRRH